MLQYPNAVTSVQVLLCKTAYQKHDTNRGFNRQYIFTGDHNKQAFTKDVLFLLCFSL